MLAGIADSSFNKAALAAHPAALVQLNSKVAKAASAYPPELIERAFAAGLDKPFKLELANAAYVVSARSAEYPEILASNRAEFDKFSASVREVVAAFVLDDYIGYLHRKFGVRINEDALGQFYD
jgi:hypothetical protein